MAFFIFVPPFLFAIFFPRGRRTAAYNRSQLGDGVGSCLGVGTCFSAESRFQAGARIGLSRWAEILSFDLRPLELRLPPVDTPKPIFGLCVGLAPASFSV